MPLILALLIILVLNWVFSYALAIIPLHLLDYLASIFWLASAMLLLLIIGWFFGE